MQLPKIDKALIALGALLGGFVIGVYSAPFITPEAATGRDIHTFNNSYHFINPLLACSNDADTLNSDQANSLEKAVTTYIQVHKENGELSDASVYYRDLNNGPWVGVNMDAAFPPGSLLKLPLAISVYKLAEDNPEFLNKKLEYSGTEVNDSQFFPPAPFQVGEHTVVELVRQMLVNSDNNAANVLANEVGADSFEATYVHLGVPQPPVAGTDYTLTTRSFSAFFRTLYNSTYLDDDSSEKLLKLMSESAFTGGIVAGVPKGTVVSHKFGERSFTDSNTAELHDCGIVYVPNHPYILCIMTKGTDFPTLETSIADISRLAYSYTVTGR